MLATLTPLVTNFCFVVNGVVREQTTTDVNIDEKMRERWCTCVCAPHFFYSLRSFIKFVAQSIIKISTTKTIELQYKPQCFVMWQFYGVVREQTTTDVNIEKKGAKDGVHACVLRIFFFGELFVSYTIVEIVPSSNQTCVIKTTTCI